MSLALCVWWTLLAYYHVQWCMISGTHLDTCTICVCNNDTQQVNCSGTKLTAIPEDPTNQTRSLVMRSTKLRNVNKTALETYRCLEALDLYNTSLINITDDAFRSLNKLKHLNLSNNEQLPFTQNKTPPQLFTGLNSLTELRVYGNTGTYNSDSYPAAALAQIPNLQELWIDGISNGSFGMEFQNMTSLKKIIIPGDIIHPPWRFCNIENLTQGIFDSLIHVTHFAIRRCLIKYIHPKTFSKMVNLQHLDLSSNTHLTVLGASASFAGLSYTKLEVLVLNSVENSFLLRCGILISKDLASKAQVLKYLKEIHMEDNAIIGFENGAIEKLPKSLERIYACKNEFELGFYTFEAFHLPNLQYVDLSHNFFTDDSAIWHKPSENHGLLCEERPTTQEETAGTHSEHSSIFTNDALVFTNLDLNSVVSDLKVLNGNFDMVEHYTKFMERDKLFRSGKLQHHYKKADQSVCPNRTLIPAASITANIPAKLEYGDVSFSKLAHPIPEFYFNETNTITKVNASNSLVYCWDGPVHGLNRLEYLDLGYNFCTDIRWSFFDKVPTLRFLSIAFNLLYIDIQLDTTGRILQNLAILETLNMSYNRIEELPRKFLINQGKLETLNMSCNLLTEFEIDILHMERISTIDLYKNHIYTLSETMRSDMETVSEKNYKQNGKTMHVNLAGNPVQCYCNNVDFLKWVLDHIMSCKFLEVNITQCFYYNQSEIHIRSRAHLDNIITNLEKHCASYTNIIIAIMVVMFFIINIIVGILVHRFRWKIRYWYYVASRNIKTKRGYISVDSLNSVGARYKFDVYIVSIEGAKDFVLETMKQRLENEKFRLFIQDDDILPGQNMYSVIANGIHVSRTVVFVISTTCEECREWKIAMRMAQEESLRRGEPMFFGVLKDASIDRGVSSDIDEIRKRSCLEYPGKTQPVNEQTFWEELVEKITQSNEHQVLSIP